MQAGASSGELGERSPDVACPLVSVVMPCLDEANGVGACVEKALRALEGMKLSGEVVVVDNGSTDGSAEIAVRAGARVVHERRRGYGAAYLRGFQEAKGVYLVMGDADESYDFLDLPRFVEPLKSGDFDMVMGSRFKGEIKPGAMPWTHRFIGNPVLSGLLRLLFGTTISDSHCGMRSFTRSAFEKMHLRSQGMEFASEMVVTALRENLRIVEVAIDYHPRKGVSKLSSVRDAWRHVRFMILYSPSYLFQLPGALLSISGAFLVVWLARGPRALFGHRWDYHVLLMGVLCLILGYNLILFDVIAKTFAMGAGFARPKQWLRSLTARFTLERGLILGSAMFLAGLALELKIIADWIASGYGELMAVRGMAIGMTGMVLGAQTAFASFLMSLLLIERR